MVELKQEDIKAGVTQEEKDKFGFWGYQGKKFKKCPGCNKPVPAEWKSHNCGWGKEDAQSEEQQQKEEDIMVDSVVMVTNSINDAKNVCQNSLQDYTNQDLLFVADMLRRTKIALTLRKPY